MSGLRAQWQRIFDQPGSLRAAALIRIFIGPIVVLHLWPFIEDMLRAATTPTAFTRPG